MGSTAIVAAAITGALLVAPTGAVASSPPASALVATNGAGRSVAAWTEQSGTVVAAERYAPGTPWIGTRRVYVPLPPFCVIHTCFTETVAPAALSLADSGDAFLVMREDVSAGRHCSTIAFARSYGGGLSRLHLVEGLIDPRYCHGHHGQGNVSGAVSTIGLDGTAAFAFIQSSGSFSAVAFGTVTGDGRLLRDRGQYGNRRDKALQLVVSPTGRATLVWHAGWDVRNRRLEVRFADFGADAPTAIGTVNPFPDSLMPVFRPALSVAGDGTQTVTYDGWAMVGGVLRNGHVEQHRPGPDTDWSQPALLP